MKKHFKNMEISEIKMLGLSNNKAKTIKEISNLYLNKNIEDLSNLSNKELHQTLLSVFGIGPWSVNMFEIFSIGKLDVFSSKDAGLRLAMNNASMVKPESDWKKYDEYAEKWSPYKTIASLHLLEIGGLEYFYFSNYQSFCGVNLNIMSGLWFTSSM